MSHEIMNDNAFYSLRQPAWYKLGYVSESEQGILEVISIMEAEGVQVPEVYERPIAYQGASEWYEMPKHRALIGYVNGEPTPYAVVSDAYVTVTHQDIISIWHQALEATPVETLGFLGNGNRMFISTAMPSIKIAGDGIDRYLQVINIIDGKSAIRAQSNEVRIVCANTLRMAMETHSDWTINVIHRSNPHQVLRDWIMMVYEEAQKSEEIIELGETLYDTKLNADNIDVSLSRLYLPPGDADDREFRHSKPYVEGLNHVNSVMSLVQFSPTIADHQRNTAWGLYNAVTEYEDHIRKRRTANSVMFGAGAQRKAQALHLLSGFESEAALTINN